MQARAIHPALVTTFACFFFLLAALSAGLGQTPAKPSPQQTRDHARTKVDPEINKPFQKADVREFIKRFESNDREVFVKRHEITKALGLKPGMAVADIGAGTGLFTFLIADQVGPKGKVYSVDVSREFLDYIGGQAARRRQYQIVTIRGSQDSTNLKPNSLDLAFMCDVYHHLENHDKILASIHQALRPGGALVLIEFDRVAGKSTDFVLKHIRAGQSTFRAEIESAGFVPVSAEGDLKLKENFFARFQKRTERKKGEVSKSVQVGQGIHQTETAQ
jgi:ubiquinone/menaquinone biosynthesis C-methylase UbiE